MIPNSSSTARCDHTLKGIIFGKKEEKSERERGVGIL